MKLFRRIPVASEAQDPQAEGTIEGDRGIASVNRARSLQSRVSSVLAVGLMSALALGLLTWYYVQTYSRQAQARQVAQSAAASKAQGEMPLPALGRVDPPQWMAAEKPLVQEGESPVLEQVLGPPPEPPMSSPYGGEGFNSAVPPPAPISYAAPAEKSPAQLAYERRLSGPVFSVSSADDNAATASSATPPDLGGPPSLDESPVNAPEGTGGDSVLGGLLKPSVTPAVRAKVLPEERLLLPKGAFIDCTLETAIDSSLPGLTTCITATDTFGVDGKVVLLERGTKLVGETRGDVRHGSARVFVLWSEARTPTGVVVPIASPGTDELGRSGLPGEVNRHFFERFGAAILISVIDGAIQAAVQSDGGGDTVIYNPSTSADIMTEVLKSTVNIPPTVVKRNGDRIQVLVARDLDFRSVYELRPATVRY
jgi:type IV secretion system protein VirB10